MRDPRRAARHSRARRSACGLHYAVPVTTPEHDESGRDTARELDQVLASEPMDSLLVRRLIRAHAATLRAAGLPPEQMLVRLKSLIEPPLAARPAPHRPATDQEWLRLRMTRWAVESYYGVSGRETEERDDGGP